MSTDADRDRPPVRGDVARLVLPALGVLVLVGLVAVAARGSTPTGSGGTRWSTLTSLLDIVVSFAVVGFAVATVVTIYVMHQRERSIAYERSGLGLMYAFLFVAVATAIARHYNLSATAPPQPAGRGGRSQPLPIGGGGKHHYQPPHVLWLPVLAVLVLIGIAVATVLIADRRRRRSLSPGEEDMAENLAAVLEDALDDLRRERDSRRAVIAAYARLERVLAAYGLPRQASETPEEYLARILGSLDVDEGAIRSLTSLFAQAKFSQHEVDVTMKEEAIAALVRVRDELRRGLSRETSRSIRPLRTNSSADSTA